MTTSPCPICGGVYALRKSDGKIRRHGYGCPGGTWSGEMSMQSDEDDEYLAMVERQRAAALATIERVKAVVIAERRNAPMTPTGALARAYQQGRRDATATFRAAIEANAARDKADVAMEEML